jgi:hypothetical protein
MSLRRFALVFALMILVSIRPGRVMAGSTHLGSGDAFVTRIDLP